MNLFTLFYSYIKVRKIPILVFSIILCLLFFLYFYVATYLEDVLQGGIKKNVQNERTVTGDNIALTYTKEHGVVISYSAKRTETEDDTVIIQSYAPRLVYRFANTSKNPIHVKGDFGVYNQKTKIVIFEQSVVLQYNTTTITAPYAEFFIEEDKVIFPRGGTVEDSNILKAETIEWNIITNVITMEEPRIFIIAGKQ